jgi:hypothetical protein
MHCRGVRQEDPLSPIPFLLAMEPLNLLFRKAQNDGLLSNLNPQFEAFRVFMYADDAAIFIGPTASHLQVTNHILEIFASAGGLHTNLSKTEYYPIRCEGLDLSFLTSSGSSLSTFPTSYLGLLGAATGNQETLLGCGSNIGAEG